MKCFKSLFFILFLTYRAFAATYDVLPTDKTKIKTGDFITIKIASTNGETPALVGKRIGNILYVMKQRGNKLDVIVAPPSTGEDELKEDEDRFVLKGFEFINTQNARPIKDYLTEDLFYDLKQSSTLWNIAFLALFLMGLYFIYQFYKMKKLKAKERKVRKARAEDLLLWLKSAQSREELEKVGA